MVWFQCEDCGDNLKKPKLLNHFHACSASRLSCIDCGTIFDRYSVQHHTQCVSEAEKYGIKGDQGNKGFPVKSTEVRQGVADVDLSMGLSGQPPWSCSLCNVKASGREALESHSRGRKHQSKVKAAVARSSFPALSAQAGESKNEQGEGYCISNNGNSLDRQGAETLIKGNAPEVRSSDGFIKSVAENGSADDVKRVEDAKRKKKRKKGEGIEEQPKKKQLLEKNLSEKIMQKQTRTEHATADLSKVVKWKKLVRKELQVRPDGAMKTKELKHRILPLAQRAAESAGIVGDEKLFELELMRQISSSSKFFLEGKLVQLASKSMVKVC